MSGHVGLPRFRAFRNGVQGTSAAPRQRLLARTRRSPLVGRPDLLAPLDRYLLVCERCAAWTPHTYRLPQYSAGVEYSHYGCTVCGTDRVFGCGGGVS